MNTLRIFGLNATKKYADGIADSLDVDLARHVEESFADNEPYIRSDVNVRDCDCFVVQSLYDDDDESVAEKFIKLLFFIGSLRDASARRITAVLPYLAFSRQDRKTESRAPITTKYVAKLIETAGADRLLTMDVHNLSAFQNAFRVPTDNLEAKNLLADYVSSHLDGGAGLVVLSPDSGGMGRARRFRNALTGNLKADVGLAYLDKTHTGKAIQGHNIIGDVKGKTVVIIDDMISSGATLVECVKALESRGAKVWGACATHGLFVGKIDANFSYLNRVVVTDTILRSTLKEENVKKLDIISTTGMFAQAIRRTHDEGGSISDLLK